MGLGLRPSLAQGIQARQRLERKRSAQAGEERRTNGQFGPRSILRRFRQAQLDVEAGLDELPGREFWWPHLEEDERSRDIGLSADDIRGSPEALDSPARTGSQAAAIGLHSADAGPPVAEVVWLGEERPHVLARSEQVAGGAVGRHVDESSLF